MTTIPATQMRTVTRTSNDRAAEVLTKASIGRGGHLQEWPKSLSVSHAQSGTLVALRLSLERREERQLNPLRRPEPHVSVRPRRHHGNRELLRARGGEPLSELDRIGDLKRDAQRAGDASLACLELVDLFSLLGRKQLERRPPRVEDRPATAFAFPGGQHRQPQHIAVETKCAHVVLAGKSEPKLLDRALGHRRCA